MVVIVDDVDDVDMEEDEGSRMARNKLLSTTGIKFMGTTELTFGILFRMSLICYFWRTKPLQFHGQVGVFSGLRTLLWYTDFLLRRFLCIFKSNEIMPLAHFLSKVDGKISCTVWGNNSTISVIHENLNY